MSEQPVALLHIPVTDIIPHPHNRVIYGEILPEPGMVDSISEHGVLVPLVVTDTTYDGKRRLISGERRLVNAIEAGLAYVPVVIRVFESEAQQVQALIEYNHQREESEVQKTRKILSYKNTLSELAEARKRANLNGAESSSVPSGDAREESGRTDEVIAERLGITRRKVRDLIVVWSDEYRAEQIQKLREMGVKETAIIESAWSVVRNDRVNETISLSKAASNISSLIIESMPKKKGAKAKPVKPPKSKFPARVPTAEDRFLCREMIETDEFGALKFGQLGSGHDAVPAIMARGYLFEFAYTNLFKAFVRDQLHMLPKAPPTPVEEVIEEVQSE